MNSSFFGKYLLFIGKLGLFQFDILSYKHFILQIEQSGLF